MKPQPATASDVRAAQAKLSKRLYAALLTAKSERDRREAILQQTPLGTVAYTAAWNRYIAATIRKDDAIRELQRNHFHVTPKDRW